MLKFDACSDKKLSAKDVGLPDIFQETIYSKSCLGRSDLSIIIASRPHSATCPLICASYSPSGRSKLALWYNNVVAINPVSRERPFEEEGLKKA